MRSRIFSSRIVTCVVLFCLSVMTVMAQSSGDKLYNQGLQLQKTMTVAAQNSAISKFTSAKKLYDSAAKKAQCDQAISVSRNIIKSLGSGGSKSRSTGKTAVTETKVVSVEPTLEVGNESFEIPLDARTLNVSVVTNQDSWDATAASCADGSSFLTVVKSGSGSFEIRVPENQKYMTRQQKVIVSSPAGLTREITVTQTGRRIEIEANKKILKFKEKGGTQKVDLSCNSDYTYADNSDENWYIGSKPEWITVVLTGKRDKSKAEELGSKITGFFKGKSKSDNPDMINSQIAVECSHLIPGTKEAFTGRSGEITVCSGDRTMTIHVSQVGKEATVK